MIHPDVLAPIAPRPLRQIQPVGASGVSFTLPAPVHMSSLAAVAPSPAVEALTSGLGDAAIEMLRAKRDVIIAEVNRRVNLPVVSEDLEARLFGALFDVLLEVADDVL